MLEIVKWSSNVFSSETVISIDRLSYNNNLNVDLDSKIIIDGVLKVLILIVKKVGVLLYADGIEKIAENKNDLQLVLDIFNILCKNKI